MAVAGLLLIEGDQRVAFGRVLDVFMQTTFEPPLAMALPYDRPGQAPAPRSSGLGVAAAGRRPRTPDGQGGDVRGERVAAR